MKKQTQAEKMQCENGSEVTKEQETTANTSEKDDATDNVTGAEGAAPGKEISKENESVSGPFEDFPEEVFREVVNVNLVGTFLMTQAVGRRMVLAKKSGSIINIGSIYGMVSPL